MPRVDLAGALDVAGFVATAERAMIEASVEALTVTWFDHWHRTRERPQSYMSAARGLWWMSTHNRFTTELPPLTEAWPALVWLADTPDTKAAPLFAHYRQAMETTAASIPRWTDKTVESRMVQAERLHAGCRTYLAPQLVMVREILTQ